MQLLGHLHRGGEGRGSRVEIEQDVVGAIEIVDGLLCGEYGRTRLSSGWVLVSLAVMPLLAMMMARKQGRSIHHEIIWLGAAAYTPSIIAIEAYLLWRGE